mmetsp:Transcript_25119/g.38868  ORF Transcript_25119/g.38868 Transcript_25119/m.38868 type:complete len:308 (+) Transcript_25119:121-1044(+)|eukprot:CAMPEP_0196803114 /NCGR_PEP_ID=MMETSP1362-20130617/2540_1 /TAXON_ID=163516 /ORGANISM="Leptocylindrus danicus, Strain CCMP1856" /LENGTH=307 /DNA_ID=CAMNT_0042174555 /DNA_START=37 /DNA_END=960 /DNA_ORIENTATION=-
MEHASSNGNNNAALFEAAAGGDVHEIAAQVAAMEQMRAFQHAQSQFQDSADADDTTENDSAELPAGANKASSKPKKLSWVHLKTIYTNNSPFGMSAADDCNKLRPMPVTNEETVLIAKQNRNLFPIGFYEMTCRKRGVTKGRGEWKDKETLKLVHCCAERQGCIFKVRYCRVVAGIEVWTSGAHDPDKHKAPPKRGLLPDVRQYVTEHHKESQKAIIEGLIEQNLIDPDTFDEKEIKKIKQQIKRRKLTVKSNNKIQNLLTLQNDPVEVYHMPTNTDNNSNTISLDEDNTNVNLADLVGEEHMHAFV